jgi:PilZ domain
MAGMVPRTEAIRIYLNEDRQGVVTCVHCGVTRTINMSNYTDDCLGKRSLKVKCSICNKIFHIKFDLRKYPRLDVNFPGKLCYHRAEKAIDDITIISLSFGGVHFIINSDLKIKDGDIYLINFQLDDEYCSVICEEILIKRVDGRLVGAEFYQSDKYNHALDFYIAEALWDT